MDLDKFLNKTDIQLYRGILHKIYKDFDNMEPSVLGDLLDKLKELHTELDKVVQQRNTQQMYNTPYIKRLNQLKIYSSKKNQNLFLVCIDLTMITYLGSHHQLLFDSHQYSG